MRKNKMPDLNDFYAFNSTKGGSDGNTDTTATIAGGLAGALYGYDAIPEKWLNILIKRDYIEEMCEKAEEKWIKK